MAKDSLDKRLEQLLREKSDYERNGDENFVEFDFVTYEDEVSKNQSQRRIEGMARENQTKVGTR
ncbi:MAG: hypothetical protein KKA07_10135 [Bacteroidetes bacterium]|nr:hypothetical protein [Bacteroidota bacterium]MBU1719419.1 hypothetical protein [Bacteroidota bacterium]